MTVLGLAVGALLCASGTRLAVVAFLGAAVAATVAPGVAGSSAQISGPFEAVGTWTAALAAALVLLQRGSIRHLALPALGAGAVLAAASVPNAAVVLGLWTLGTAAAVLSAGSGDEGRRWAALLCCLDLLLLAGVASTATRSFQGWPMTISELGTVLLLMSAALRIPLVASPSEARWPSGLLIVRTQVAVLVSAAVFGAGTTVAESALVIAGLMFATAPWSGRPRHADGVQELCLFAMTAAAGQLGWISPGWTWGALAAGTLTYNLRLMVGRGTAGQWAGTLSRSAGFGLASLPVTAALLEGVTPRRGWLAALLLFALLAGVAGRARLPADSPVARARGRRQPAGSGDPSWDAVRGIVVVAAAAAASVCGALLWLPAPPAGGPIGWPPLWAVGAVMLAGGAGAFVPALVPGRAPKLAPPGGGLIAELLAKLGRLAVPVPGRRLVWALLALVTLGAAAAWIAGLARGFL